ncbi:hypothetical protein Tco_0963663 [Tanacetum coccineum]
MTTPHPFVTPRARVLILFIILSDSDDEVTTLPVRPAPPSPDYVPVSPNYSPDSNLDSDPSGDDLSDEDLTETAEPLPIQTTLTLVVHPPPPSLFPSSSLLPPSLLPSSFSPPPSLLPSSSQKRSRSPSLVPPLAVPLPPLAVPLPPPAVPLPPLAVPLPPSKVLPERIESVGDDVETLRARLTSSEQETVTLHDRLRAVYAEQEVSELRDFWVTDRLEILKLRSQAEAANRGTTSITGSAQMNIRDLIESHRTDRLEMAELRSRSNDIEASFWEIERHLVVCAIETIAIYEAKTRVTRNSKNQVEHQEAKVTKDASNKRKWEGDHNGSSSQQQNKGHKLIRAHAAKPSNRKCVETASRFAYDVVKSEERWRHGLL